MISMLKLDGLTIKLTYEGGELLEAATRGDGEVGEIVTHNTRAIGGIPAHIRYEDRLVITGEASSNSIPAEKLAAACCKMLLNCPEALPDSLYGYVGWLFTRYKDFSIKYEGNRDLWEAVNSSLSPSSPKLSFG